MEVWMCGCMERNSRPVRPVYISAVVANSSPFLQLKEVTSNLETEVVSEKCGSGVTPYINRCQVQWWKAKDIWNWAGNVGQTAAAMEAHGAE